MHRSRGSRLLVAAGAVVALAAPATATAATPPVAVVVHLQGAPSPLLPADARELRQAALDDVSALLNARGLLAADRSLTESLVQRHVVRSGSVFAPTFLAGVRSEVGADVLLAVGVEVEGGRLGASIRALSTADGGLLGIGVAQAAADTTGWRPALITALKAALPALTPPAAVPPLVLLPARPMGAGPRVADAATSLVLAAALADGRWRPVDPALVAGAVADSGRDLQRLDARGREVLRETFGVDWAAVPEIVSFGIAARAAGPVPLLEPGSPTEPDLAEFELSVRLLDLRTGLVGGTAAIRVPGGPVEGWFGRVDRPSDLERIRAAADQVWSRFQQLVQEKKS
ncbi:hypothetical protein FJ250_02425 [bacterium]|nr:hypothetical protein [bacterium]